MLSRQQRRAHEKLLRSLPKTLKPVPKQEWPRHYVDITRIAVWRSRFYLVQAFQEDDGIVRLTVNRATVSGDRWKDGISWERLQEIKNEVGYRDFDAVEIYPKAEDEVNVANMRHLWVLPEPLSFAWREDRKQ